MKWTTLVLILFVANVSLGQRDLTPSKKRDAFGSRDLRSLRNFGLQFQVGGTSYLTRLNNPQIDVTNSTSGFRGNYTHDPFGKLGAFAEIGLFHFPKKRSSLSMKLKTVLVSYFDYGVGFKYFRGGENIDANFIDLGGNLVDSQTESFKFSHGNVYGRFSIHKNIHFKRHREKTNFFLDNSLGVNVDYRVLTTSDEYLWHDAMMQEQAYTKPLQIQLHYGLGFGFRLKRGSYLIPFVRLPIVGYQSTLGVPATSGKGANSFGRPSSHWFSTRHWPILFGIKYMFLFEKKSKKGDCPAVEINGQDQDTQRNR